MPPARRQAVIIGAGVESLVTACHLARRGLETLVLEKRGEPGGRHAKWPGGGPASLVFDGPIRIDPNVARDLQLEQHGLELDSSPRTLATIAADGRVLTLSSETASSQTAITPFSSRDAEAYPRFMATISRLVQALSPLMHRAPPGNPAHTEDIWTALLTGRRYLGLSKREAFALLRWPPMPVADLVGEWFESDPLQAIIATCGLFGAFAGPHSSGTAALLLLRAIANDGLTGPVSRVRGGGPALVQALAACAGASRVELRSRAEAVRVIVEGERAVGVELGDGTMVKADAVVSGLDPKRTLLELLEPESTPPELARRARNIRSRGTIARARLVVDGQRRHPFGSSGPVPETLHVAPSIDHLEHAFDAMKYGGWADEPWLEVAVHRPGDTSDQSGRAVLSVTAHYVPRTLRDRRWLDAREQLGDAIVAAMERHLPGLASRVLAREVLSPEDLEMELGLTGAHPFHAEMALDQLWIARPALGLGGYRSPVEGLYLCGPGVHPGLGPVGTSGSLASREILRDMKRQMD
jgi:phytoene dehydrogenase-like protein